MLRRDGEPDHRKVKDFKVQKCIKQIHFAMPPNSFCMVSKDSCLMKTSKKRYSGLTITFQHINLQK